MKWTTKLAELVPDNNPDEDDDEDDCGHHHARYHPGPGAVAGGLVRACHRAAGLVPLVLSVGQLASILKVEMDPPAPGPGVHLL